jgi:hypothetical protein
MHARLVRSFPSTTRFRRMAKVSSGDDNVIWHDNGDVYFNGGKIDNMHVYAP